MKRLFPFLSFFIVLIQLLANPAHADSYPEDKPSLGQCVALPDSKNYISDIHLNPVLYTCLYTCVDNTGKSSNIQAHHSFFRDPNNLMAEMIGMVCDGVEIGTRQIGESQIASMKAVHAFWARSSERAEIKHWAIANHVGLPASETKLLRETFNQAITKVAMSLLPVDPQTYPELREAALVFLEIASDTAKGRQELEASIQRISSGEKQKTKTQKTIDLYIQSLGGFLL